MNGLDGIHQFGRKNVTRVLSKEIVGQIYGLREKKRGKCH